MLLFVTRRLIQAALTIFGVMLLTFLLFNLAAGDIAAEYVPPQKGEAASPKLSPSCAAAAFTDTVRTRGV